MLETYGSLSVFTQYGKALKGEAGGLGARDLESPPAVTSLSETLFINS